ncbi:hypothetical protein [Actinosynnema sp. NPDC020468]|uniref:hypothetical protein n=1 Tax=Actinosynnema sp. NPDC020468 TaxID=3154488 RepID=UPI0033FFDCB3
MDGDPVDEVRRAVDGAVGGPADAGEALGSVLLAVGRSGDAESISRAAQVLVEADPRVWLALDGAARRRSWYPSTWAEEAAERFAGDRPGVLDVLLAACHRNGFVREAAVAVIAEREDEVLLPVVALRAADWVPQVRERARPVCRRTLDRAPTAAVGLAPVAFLLRDRRVGGWLADALEEWFRAGPPEALDAGLAARDRRTRRAAHTVGLAAGRLGLDRMVRAATTDRDLPIRIRCAEAAIRAARAVGDEDVPRRLLAGGTAAVRAEAVRALGNEVDAEAALADRSGLVRAVAQALVRRAGVDPAARYRDLLARRPPDPAVIAGLGDTGSPADADLIRPWLAHPSSRGRAEAVRALRRLGVTSPGPLLPLLTDPVSSVTRQATLSLLRQAEALDERELGRLLDDHHPRHVRTAAYRLLRAHGPWTRIAVDLRLVTDPDLRADARGDLTAWLERDAATTYAVPRGSRAEELAALITAAEPVLGASRTRALRFHLGATR